MSSSFSNSFDSEIVLLGGSQKQHRAGKHSRVGTLTSVNIEDEEDLNIEDSISVRSLTSYSVNSGDIKIGFFSLSVRDFVHSILMILGQIFKSLSSLSPVYQQSLSSLSAVSQQSLSSLSAASQ